MGLTKDLECMMDILKKEKEEYGEYFLLDFDKFKQIWLLANMNLINQVHSNIFIHINLNI